MEVNIRRLVKQLGCTSIAFLIGTLLAAPAGAHITIYPEQAKKGGYAVLSFRTPNERNDASTIKVEIVFPREHPISNVNVQPIAGWTYSIERHEMTESAQSSPEAEHRTQSYREQESGKATRIAASTTRGQDVVLVHTASEHGSAKQTGPVSKITWEGGKIGPGEFQEFRVSLGPLPKEVDELVFKAIQTYDSGEVVSWIETQAPGAPEPEHPAPILKLIGVSESTSPTPQTQASPASKTAEGSTASMPLSVIALVVSAVSLIVGGVALSRSFGKQAPTS